MPKGYLLTQDDGSLKDVGNVLATVTSIDLKTVAQTSLYTVPAGKKAVVLDVLILISDADTASVPATVRIGKSAAFTEFLAATALTGLLGAGQYIRLAGAGSLLVHKTFSAGDVIALDVTVGATATTLTATVYLLGFLV